VSASQTVCDSCGVTLELGDWPFCQGGHGRPSFAVQTLEPYIDKNLGASSIMSPQEKLRAGIRGVEIRSHAQRARAMKERGLADLRDLPLSDVERR
jgi:hypothetical protein